MTATNAALLTALSANQQARWTNGQYYSTPGQQRSTLAQTLNVMTAIPLWVPPVAPGGTAHTITRLGAEVTGAGSAGSILRLGVYDDNGSGAPGTLLAEAAGTPANTIDGTSATAQEITLTTPITLTNKTLVWLAAVCQVAAATERVLATNGFQLPIGAASLASATGSSVVLGYQVTSVSGALPGSWTGATTIASPILVVAKVT